MLVKSEWRTVSGVAHEVNDLVRAIGRPSGVIDDVFDGADTAQGDGNEIVELDPRAIGNLEAWALTMLGLTSKKQ